MKGKPLFGIKDAVKLRLVKPGWRMMGPGKNARLDTRTVRIDAMQVYDFCNGALRIVGEMAL